MNSINELFPESHDCKVLYFASSRNIGFTAHLSDFAITPSSRISFLYLSGEREQFPGVFKKLDGAKIKREIIKTLDTSRNIQRHVFRLKKIIAQFRPKVVHSQTNYQLLLSAILKPFYGYKIIQTIHYFGNGSNSAGSFLVKLYLKVMCLLFADVVIFQSEYVGENFRILKRKSFTLPMGFSSPSEVPQKSIPFNGPIRIIYAARFHHAKNHEWLINTITSSLEENNWELILPGNGEEYQKLLSQISLNNNRKIKMPGLVDRLEIDRLYRQAHIAVVPSKSETLGHNIIEPLAYGIPVISFPVGIAPTIATRTSAVTCVPFFDKEAMLSAIKAKLENPSSYQQASIEALLYFRENLTWRTHMQHYERMITALIPYNNFS